MKNKKRKECPQCDKHGYYIMDCHRTRINSDGNPYEFHWQEARKCWNCGGKGYIDE